MQAPVFIATTDNENGNTGSRRNNNGGGGGRRNNNNGGGGGGIRYNGGTDSGSQATGNFLSCKFNKAMGDVADKMVGSVVGLVA